MGNEIDVVVRARNDTKTTFAEVRRDGAKLGADVGVDVTRNITTKLNQSVSTSFAEAGSRIGDSVGRRINERVSERLRDARGRFSSSEKVNVDVDVDVDEKSFLSRVGAMAQQAGDKVSGAIGGAFQSVFSGDVLSLIIKVVGGALVAAVALPAIGAALVAGILLALGGGVIGLGIASALKDPQITGAVGDLKKKIGGMFEEFGKPFRGPVANFLEKFSGFLDSAAPQMDRLSQAFAPLLDSLGTGLIGFLQNAMPGIVDAVEASKPLFDTLAKHMPAIGQAVGDFMRNIADGAPGANAFFSDMLSLLEKILPVVGAAIAAFSNLYIGASEAAEKVKEAFLRMALFVIDMIGTIAVGAARAFGWIPGLGNKLKGAERRFNQFRKQVNDELSKIRDKTVRISVQVIGDIAAVGAADIGRALRNAGGGVVGAAVGGVHNGLRWVGEQGPELVNMPPGTTVHSAADSQRMMRQATAGGGGMGSFVVQLVVDGAVLAEQIVEPTRAMIASRFQGDVQSALGKAY